MAEVPERMFFQMQDDLRDESLSGLRVYRAGCEAVLAAGRYDRGIETCYHAVLEELEYRGEL